VKIFSIKGKIETMNICSNEKHEVLTVESKASAFYFTAETTNEMALKISSDMGIVEPSVSDDF